MKIQFLSVGKAHEAYVKEGIELFSKRISNYYSVEWKLIASPKNASQLDIAMLKEKEASIILEIIGKDDCLVLLDEKGKNYSSPQMAALITMQADKGIKQLLFLIGGAFGVTDAVVKRANFIWSLSNLVFPHQLVRLILAEQIYRACSIAKNEKYHHQ